MKILRIILLSLLGIVVLLVLGIFIFLKTFDVNKYLPKITAQIGQIINREVAISHADLGFSFSKGLSLNLKNLSIKDDPLFSTSNFLSVEQIYLGLDVMPLLSKKEVHIIKIVISSPKVSIIRSAEGLINAQSMAPKSPTTSPQPTSSSTSSAPVATTPASPTTGGMPVIVIQSILIEHGQLSFEDKAPQFPMQVLITDIEGRINDFSSVSPFNVNLSANALAKAQNNIDMSARCSVDLSNNSVSMTDLKIQTDLKELDWTKVKTISSVFEKVSFWPKEAKGNVLVQTPSLSVTSKGLEKFSFQVSLKDGYMEVGGLNILKLILDKLNFIPGLEGQIASNLPADLKSKLDKDITILNKIEIDSQLDNSGLTIKRSEIESELFLILAQGTLGLDATADIDVKTYLTSDLSSHLVASVKPLKGLLDEHNRLFLAGKLTGQGSSMKFTVQVDDIAKQVAISEGTNQLGKILDKNPEVKSILNSVLGGGSDAQETTSPDQGQAQEKSSEELINDVFKKFRKKE